MIQSIKGTKDLLPDAIGNWHFIEENFRKSSAKYGYEEIRTPIFEKTEVFSRSIGENTDIVNKEMYTFEDRSGDSITLRPEMTAAIGRAVLQHSLAAQSSILRYWYFGPYFRHERPQQGRYRQFHQYGAECIQSPFPESDVECILLADDIFRSIGISEYKLFLNSLGNDETRKNYRQALVDYFQSVKADLSEDSKSRLETNPLRILDSKDRQDQGSINNAPKILDYLDEESTEHFGKVTSQLDSLDVGYDIQPRLVRGLDYYCHTVFEFQSDALGAQDSFGGGGRYNGLIQQLGGKKEVPAVGFALGVERMLMILEKTDSLPKDKPKPDVYIVVQSADYVEYAQNVAKILRNMDLKIVSDVLRRSMKAQFRESNKLNSNFTIIIGEEEVSRKIVQIKNMSNSEQTECQIENLDKYKFIP